MTRFTYRLNQIMPCPPGIVLVWKNDDGTEYREQCKLLGLAEVDEEVWGDGINDLIKVTSLGNHVVHLRWSGEPDGCEIAEEGSNFAGAVSEKVESYT